MLFILYALLAFLSHTWYITIYHIWSIYPCYEPVWPVHNNTSSRWSLIQVQGTDFAVRWLITLSTVFHSSVILQCLVKFQGSEDNQGLESFLCYEFYFSFIFFAFIGRLDSMVSKAVADLNYSVCWNVWRGWHTLNHYFSFFFSSLHAPDGEEEASNIPKEGRPEFSEFSNSVTNTVSHCCLDKRNNAGYRVHFNQCIVFGGGS